MASEPAIVARGVAAVAAVAASAACGGSSSTPPGVQLAQAVVAAVEAAQVAKQPWRCAAADGPALAEETMTVGKRAWKLSGGTMRLEQGAASGTAGGGGGDGDGGTIRKDRREVVAATTGSITIGVVADAGGAAPLTLEALAALRGKLAAADLVVTLGGMGASQAELEATLGALAEGAPWPVVALPGDLEPAAAQAAAVARLRAKGGVVIDGRRARRIELPGATIATLPGAGAAARLVAGVEGCGYRAADAAAAFAELTKRDGLRIVASAEAPRIIVGGEPAGEPALTAGPDRPIDLALHGPTAETAAATPARSGTRDGAAVPLTPGTSDATTRLPGPQRAPSAGLLSLSADGTWRWKPLAGAGAGE
jgi:hypothetical protein